MNDDIRAIEEEFKEDLHKFLLSTGMVDKILPEAPDIEERWHGIAESYMPDALREFNGDYPMVAFGWIMYVGMALAKYWDVEWETYSNVKDIYAYLRDRIDFDHMDDYICQNVLCLDQKQREIVDNTVGECASRTYNRLCHLHLEPGSANAFRAFVAVLHQMYLMGVAVELRHLGYHMTKI
mgnify:CR=1 FL=1